MKKSNKSVSQLNIPGCVPNPASTTCAQHEDNLAGTGLLTLSEGLLAGCDPVILPVVHSYLDDADPDDQMFLDAWEKCGRGDAHTGMRVELRRAARQTLTPLGIACLVRYARGLEDELAAMAPRVEASQGLLTQAQDDGSRRRQAGLSRSRPSRSTSVRTPRRRRRSR